MDFFQICTKEVRGGKHEVYPDFTVGRSKDLMIRGSSFYAIWDEERGLWSTDQYDVVRIVDQAVYDYADKLAATGVACKVKPISSFNTNVWSQFQKFLRNVSDNYHQLDMKLTFANTEVKKSDHVSRRLPYDLAPGDHSAWDELTGVLYSPEELAKIEWAIGAVISGDSKKLEKFQVFYGPGGTGKSTILKIIEKLFEGYTAMFEAKALVGNNNSFATEAFKSNPLVAIQHDGDLSKIEDNTKLNSIVGHDKMLINEKYKPGYEMKIQAFLFMGTNKPVKITDAKSGVIRRLIDVKPTGRKLDPNHYHTLMSRIDFELGAIASHCLEVYRTMGKNYYNAYQPLDMMLQTDVFFNFIEANYDIFKEQDGATLKQAYAIYKEYCLDSELEFKLPLYKFREEFKNYFENFEDRAMVDGVQMRSYFSGFTARPFRVPVEPVTKPPVFSLVMDEVTSILDDEFMDQPAQYANASENPKLYWTDEEREIKGVMQKPKPDQVVSTTLADLDTSKLHFVKVPENHIVIDFDLKGDDGEKSLERNLEAASAWPATYAELSKSGAGVHLHYEYTGGDASELATGYSDGIEIKVYSGNSSLRRRLTKCNSVPIAAISSGLPFKEKKMANTNTLQNEKSIRDMIARNLRKEFHPGTKPSVDFIQKILDDAYKSGLVYDVTDLRPRIMAFANNSSNQAMVCLKTVQKMKFKQDENVALEASSGYDMNPDSLADVTDDAPLVVFDVEVYPNLFVICWKYVDSPDVVRMINPHVQDIERLLKYRLVGFYNRNYDNHILWAAYLGYNNAELYQLSQRIISGVQGAKFGEAYRLSYADIYDFASEKMTLKKWQIKLGIHHQEMDLPWDQPAPEDRWLDITEYCVNDVVSTQAVLEDRKQDLVARQILADLSGLTVNDTTRMHAERIIFGNDRKPQDKFIYTDLSKEFPGYTFDPYSKTDKSVYRGETVGEGGYVYGEPGIYEYVELLDVASMHPTSIEQLDLFGTYTGKFSELKNARLAIKNAVAALKESDFRLARVHLADAREMLDGKLKPHLETPEGETEAPLIKRLKALSDALKLVINSIYGYTSATFDNVFKDKRNIDNIVAKRGALFMIDLKHFVQEHGYTVAHIKTDSIKIPDATPEFIEMVKEFGKKYGYDFEHEATYEKLCLANDAVYIAKSEGNKWTATGAQFQHPYVFKKLFSGDNIMFDDLCETKSVREGALYLDFGSEAVEAMDYLAREVKAIMSRTDKTNEENQKLADSLTHDTMTRVINNLQFTGRTGRFMPVLPEAGGATLYRVKDNKLYAVTGTKNCFWLEAEQVAEKFGVDKPFFELEMLEDLVDMNYFNRLADEAVKAIEKFGDFEKFVSE